MERNGRLRRPPFKQVVLVSRSTKASAASLRWSATGAFGARLSNKSCSSPDPRRRAQRACDGAQRAPSAPDFQTTRARLPIHEGERSEPEMERQTSLELANSTLGKLGSNS